MVMGKRKSRVPLPPVFEPRPPRVRVRKSRVGIGGRPRQLLATWPFPDEVERERQRVRSYERYHAKRQALVDRLGEEVVREMERAAKSAAATKRNRAWWASLSPEEQHRYMSEMGRKGGGRPWADAEAKRAHMARLGRASAVKINERLAAMPEEERRAWLAERGRRVSEGRKRNEAARAQGGQP